MVLLRNQNKSNLYKHEDKSLTKILFDAKKLILTVNEKRITNIRTLLDIVQKRIIW